MQKSDSIGKLVEALAAVQGKAKPAKFDSENPFFKNRYASLGSVADACRTLLSANGLAVLQPVSGDVNGVTITTMISHISGEWISDAITIKPAKADAQGMGSAVTYGRRYGLASMVGIVSDEDDDGNHASVPAKEDKPKAVKSPEKPVSSKPSESDGSTLYTTTLFQSVKTKEGESAKGKWTRYYGKGDDGAWYSTFSGTVGEQWKEMEGVEVDIAYQVEVTAKGENRTIVNIEATPEKGEEQPSQEDDDLKF